MLISHSHRFAYIHIPKVAGVSISRTLGCRYGTPIDHYWGNRLLKAIGINVNHYAPYQLKKFRLHTPAWILKRELPPAVFADLFKFSFVRNPWDLLVSHYHFVVRTQSHHRNRRAGQLGSFEQYAHYEMGRGKISQSAMLTDADGRLLVDFVGRFETLDADFAQVCRRIGTTVLLPRLNSTVHADYRSYYSDRLAAEVGSYFAADAARFGYCFDGFAPASATPASPAKSPVAARTVAQRPGGRLDLAGAVLATTMKALRPLEISPPPAD